MSGLLRDFRFAIRTLLKNPGVGAVAALTLALGIGVTTAVFSIFHGVLLTPLAYPQPDELVLVYDTQPACKTCPASLQKFHDWRERNRVFAAIGGSTSWSWVLTGSGEATRINGVRTTHSLVDVLGVQPMIGRWYSQQEDQHGAPKVAVLSHAIWKTRFNSDPQILGRKLLLDGDPYEVIGVMPASFTHRLSDIFAPLQMKVEPAERGSHFLTTYARLKDGVTLAQAQSEMRSLGETLAREFAHNHGIDVVSYTEAIVGDVRKPLRMLLGAVLFLLLIAAANVANLLLAWGLSRRGELAIRLALGAGPRVLARQLATESVVLALLGGTLGVLLAFWTVDAFVVLAGNQLPRASNVAVNAQVLGFSAAVSVLVGLLCAVWPIVLLCRRDLAQAVREADTRTTSGAGRTIGNGLVMTEIALAFGLLAGAGLFVKNLMLLHERDTGFKTERIVAFDVGPSGTRYDTNDARVAFYRELQSRLEQVGTIESVGMTSHLPMYSYGWNGEFQIEGSLPWPANEAPLVEYRWIYGDYLKTLGVPLLAGRALDHRDGKNTRTVLINQAMAEKFWPGQNPLGRRFGQDRDRKNWYEVVGVIGNIRSYGLAERNPYEFYRTIEQAEFPSLTVVLRSSGAEPLAVIPTARQIVSAIDPAVPVTEVQTLEKVVADSVGQPRLLSALTGLFGGLAGLLAMVGVYSVLAYNVRRARREFGIRIAVGASQGNLKRLVVGRGMRLAAVGVAIGAVGAWLLTGVVKTMLHDVQPTDWTVFAGTGVAVMVVALLASYVPARAAANVDPMIVLRDS